MVIPMLVQKGSDRMLKRILSILMAIAMMSAAVVCASAEDIDSLESQLQSLKDESKKYQDILNNTKEDISEKEQYSEALVGKINVLGEQISLSHERISQLDSSISELQTKINEANQSIETQMDTLKNRIRTIYMAGGASDLEIILGARDFSDFLDKLELVKTLSAYDQNLIGNIRTTLQSVSDDKKELETQKTSLQAEQTDLKTNQNELQALLDENEALLDTLYEQNASVLSNMENASSEQSEVEQQIQAFYEKQRAAKEEEERKAREEAEKQENESDDHTSDTPSSGGDSSSGDGGSSSDGDSGDIPSGAGYTWPCPGFYYLSSEWNENRGEYNHGAIDIAGGGIMGAAVVAADSGTVISSNSSCIHNWGKSGSCGCGGGYGNYVWIDHGNGKATIYAHMSSLAVSTGEYVAKGQTLGYVGSTGESTGPHLHFECRYYGQKYNPMSEYN